MYEFTYQFRECLSENNITVNTYFGHTTNTLSRRWHNHSLMKKHNKEANKLKSPDIRKIVFNNTKIICKNNNKNRLQNP